MSDHLINAQKSEAVGGGASASNPGGPLVVRAARAARARVLRAIAGTQGAMVESRRGSFLVLVVGTIALLLVIAVVYVTVGRADRQTSSALLRQASEADVPGNVSDYIAGIIGDDRLSTFTVGSNSPRQRTYREASDRPSVTYDKDSNQNDPTATDYFSPVGAGTDPWLASTSPIWLNYDETPPPNNEPLYHKELDWSQISNISPDGRYINLFALRNNFDASFQVLTDGLRMLNANGAYDASRRTDFNAAADVDRPAYWQTRQRAMFRPATGVGIGNFEQANYLPYQYADADGDGFFDSRWTMLTTPGDIDEARSLLPSGDGYRWAVATRIIDLSGAVNVNTATEFVNEPDDEYPLGVWASDVDLRRLLSLEDAVQDYNQAFQEIVRPAGDETDNQSPIKSPDNFRGYSATRSNFANSTAAEVGDWSYRALRLGLRDGVLPSRSITSRSSILRTWPLLTPEQKADSYTERAPALFGTRFAPAVGSGTDQYVFNGVFGVADQIELLTYFASNDAAVTSRLESTLSGRFDDGSPERRTVRYSPLRDARREKVERQGKAEDGRAPDSRGPAESRALAQFATDLRHRVTTISAASPIRTSVVSAANAALGTGDLKLDALKLLGDPNTQALFRGYADVLMRDSNISGAWKGSDPNEYEKLKTMFYGYDGPELPLVMSAHLTVNALDGFDQPVGDSFGPGDGNTQTVRTVLVDENFAAALERDNNTPGNRTTGAVGTDPRPFTARDYKQFWWVEPSGKLDLNEGNEARRRLANSSDGDDQPIVPAFNVYGIEAQPFITGVASLTVYNDARFESGSTIGADDDSGNLGPDGSYDKEVTIHGRISSENRDFIARVLAFQLSNPFDEAVTLSAPFNNSQFFDARDANYPELDREESFYYIEFDGRLYKLARKVEQVFEDEATANEKQASGQPALGRDGNIGEYIGLTAAVNPVTIEGLSIPPRSSIICYAITEMPQDVLDKWRKQDRSADLPGLPPNFFRLRLTIRSWLNQQFGSGPDPNVDVVQIPRMDATTGKVAFDFNPLLTGTSVGKQVQLWRALRVGPQTVNNATDEGDKEDSPRMPAQYWDRATNPDWGPGGPSPMFYRNRRENDLLADRFRVTTNLDQSLPDSNKEIAGANAGPERDRPEDLGLDSENLNSGLTITLHAGSWRPNGAASPTPRGAIPAWALEPKAPISGSWNRGSTGKDGAAKGDFNRDDVTNSGAYTFGWWREDSTTAGREAQPELARAADRRSNSVIGNNAQARPFASLLREFYIANDRYTTDEGKSRLRVGDMLLPLTLGPTHAPLSRNRTAVTDPLVSWTTLSEALAAALSYENFNLLPADSLIKLYEPLSTAQQVHDNGNLLLDAFVPFYDDDANGEFTYGPGSNDERVGLGIPLALGVFDMFTTIPAQYGSLTNATPGLININTAGVPVLRAIPLLSPTTVTTEWNFPGWTLNQTSDIATTLAAYRDKNLRVLRDASGGTSYRPDVTFKDLSNIRPDRPDRDGRLSTTTINGIREDEGFLSIGEMLAARDADTGGNTNPRENPANIDFLGYVGRGAAGTGPGRNSSIVGIDSVLYAATGSTTRDQADEINNEFDEKLAIMNAAAGSVTTRSDVFAVWFLIHGYQRTDVENIGGKPMVPSVARRFMMIVDRSNVTAIGQKPRVLVFKEVPL
jgi:hypothetical protein